jgi:hypothetical protein
VTRRVTVFLYIVLIFFAPLKGLSQTNKETIPLVIFLKLLEAKHSITFSYADANLKGKTILVPTTELSLDEILIYLSERSELTFQRLGDRVLVIKKSKKNNSSLNSFKTQFLEEVLVTNYLTKGVTLSNDGTTSIKPETFGILPGLIEPDVLQTIQALPGVQSIEERVSSVNIRGGTHDQNLILWDGIKMYQSGHFFGLISAFNPYLTKNVLVSKNGTSAIYGDGVSGIVDMRASNNISKEASGGGGFNLINADIYAKIPINKKLEFQVSGRRSLTDIIATPTYEQYSKRMFQDTDVISSQSDEDFYFYDATLKVLYDITKKDKIRANFLNVNNDLQYKEQTVVNDRDEELNSMLRQQNLASSVEYLKDWNNRFKTSFQVYLSKYDLEATNHDITNNQRLIQKNEVYDNGIKAKLEYDFNDNLQLQTGYQFAEVGVSNLEDVNNPPFRSYIKKVIRTNSLFSELSFRSNSYNTIAKFGVRGNYFDKFSTILIEPRLTFNQRFFNYFMFEVLGEMKSQTTSQIIDLQNDFLGIEKRRWVLSNNNDEVIIEDGRAIQPVPIIQSKQLSTGIRYNQNGLLVSAEGYVKKVDGITTRSQGFQNQFQFENKIGSYQIRGLDFLINKQFENGSTWLSYSYSKNDYEFPTLNSGKKFPNNIDTRHALTFAGTYFYKSFKFALGANWRTGKPYTTYNQTTPILNNEINYNTPNNANLKDYVRTDFSMTYTFKVANATNAIAGFSLWNVLNRKNVINTYYTLDNEGAISKVENLSLGITPNFSFRLSL